MAQRGLAWPSVWHGVARRGLGLLPRGAVWRQWLPVCWRPGVGVPSRKLRIPRPPPAPSPEARAEWGPQGASLVFSPCVWQLWPVPSPGAKYDLSIPCAPPSSKHQSPSPPPATAARPDTKLLRGDAPCGSPSTLPTMGSAPVGGPSSPAPGPPGGSSPSSEKAPAAATPARGCSGVCPLCPALSFPLNFKRQQTSRGKRRGEQVPASG